ncbi:hypothetical protein AAMO2058_000180900, partial [Amorphochlora amoebiformis]
ISVFSIISAYCNGISNFGGLSLVMLKPFASATKELSGTKYVTASLVVKTWKRLMITFKRLHSKDGVRTQGLTRSILCYLQEVWDKHLASSDSIWKVACTVDPNYKKLNSSMKRKRQMHGMP